MFGSQVSRTGLLITLLGLVGLSASYCAWSKTYPFHALRDAQDDYRWVRADSSNDPAIESDELWQASATCQLPYFIGATLRAKAELKAFYDATPEEISEWRNRPARPRIVRASSNAADFPNLLKREQVEPERSIAEAEYDSLLHVKYTEWYATASKLEEQAKQWQQRLINVADQRVALSETHSQNVTMFSTNRIKQIGASDDVEQHMLWLLGLSGFSKDLLQALKARCVEVIPVKKILTQAKLWYWPIDYPASFWVGLELVFIGLFFSPISRWIGAGDPRTKWRHVRHMAQRLITTTRMVLKNKLTSGDLVLSSPIFIRSMALAPVKSDCYRASLVGNLASQMRVAFSNTAWNTCSSSPGDELMTRSNFGGRRLLLQRLVALAGSLWRADLRRRVLTGLPPALECRLAGGDAKLPM